MAAAIQVAAAFPQPAARPYYSRLDALRIAAAVSVVFLHAADSLMASQHSSSLGLATMRDVSLWAMPFFVAAAGFVHGKSRAPGSIAWLVHRAWRLLPLYVLWSIVAQVWVRLGLRQDSPSAVSFWRLLEETVLGWQHLWFIPMIIICALPVWYVSRTPEREQKLHATLWVLSAALCAGYLAVAAFISSLSVIYYLYRSPGYWFLFYVSGWLLGRGYVPVIRRVVQLEEAAVILGVVLMVAPDLWGWVATVRYAGAGLAAMAVLSAAARQRGSASKTVSVLGRATMGVYLLHPFVLIAVFRIVTLCGSVPGSVTFAIAAATLACVVSFSVVVACRRWRVGRFVFGWRGA